MTCGAVKITSVKVNNYNSTIIIVYKQKASNVHTL